MTCRGPRGPLPGDLPANVVGIRDGAPASTHEPLDPIEALKHIRTFVEAMGDGTDPKAVTGNLREVRAVLEKALKTPQPVRHD